ncbi:hypothetical protein KM043_003091 [Ampulex compressa]|nr:hypothetical protein KM043_003091 [Ampulex compressa]
MYRPETRGRTRDCYGPTLRFRYFPKTVVVVTARSERCLRKELDLHGLNCPPDAQKWNHGYIRGGAIYGTVESYRPQESPKNISERELDDLAFFSQDALRFCEIAIGDFVLILTKENGIVKTAWPTSDKTLTSISLTKNAIELNNIQGIVMAQRLNGYVTTATEFEIINCGKRQLSANPELDIIIRNYNEHKVFFMGNKISIPYYGRKLIFKIVRIKWAGGHDDIRTTKEGENALMEQFQNLSMSANERSCVKLYKALYDTKWIISKDPSKEDENNIKSRYKMSDIGGYDDLIADIKHVLEIGIGKHDNIGDFYIAKGILLYGMVGVGKSMIANALTAEYDINLFTIHSSDIYSKSLGETEKRLTDIFTEAKSKAPSIILIEDIDTLCPKRSTSSTDQERRVISRLVALFDDLRSCNVLVLATTSKVNLIDPSLRRPGRIDKEFEVYVPTPHMRIAILDKLLSKIPNTLSKEDILNISYVTHGFVGADLYGLCSQAIMHATKHQEKPDHSSGMELKITMNDFNHALIVTKPSAMREVLIEIPNVKWTDIGGQKDLKLKLKQAVEWPLRHPEAFLRMGITPPRGVLMFGPPGCSKTMIAKALATESKVNFLNIKGPELFSKWVGESEKAVREVFRKARQVAPSIIFIDEIDALGGERGPSNSSGSNVQERVLAQLLTELDGVTALGNVTLVAATNRPDKIDKALLRPGRLDRIIYVGLPDYNTRQEIFDIKMRNMPVSQEVYVQDLVELTEGYSGAEIQAVCHEAAMKALEEDLDATTIGKEHFKAALSVVTPRTPASLMKLYDEYLDIIK